MNLTIDRMIRELQSLTGEDEEEAISTAIRERLDRLNFQRARREGADSLRRYLVDVAVRTAPAGRAPARS